MRFNLPRLIGITGRAGSGKDTLADYLVRQFSYVKYSLSTPLKKILNERFDWTDKQWFDRDWKERTPWPEMDENGNQIAFSPRSWAQWLGTEVGRFIGGEDVWVNLMEREWRALNEPNVETFGELPRMVIPDVRFANEAARIHLLGGVVLRVNRDDVVAVPAHASEVGVPDSLVNLQVSNNTDIDTFIQESLHALNQCPRGDRQLIREA